MLVTLLGGASLSACSSPGVTPAAQPEAAAQPDSPIVSAQPGAWFDAQGGLSVVSAGRRLRLRLSAPVVACGPAFDSAATAEELAARASLPFHVLTEVCRETHPSILLTEESETASPAELERSYHEVARCAAADLGATSGWVPAVLAASDPCPRALGIGWRLPQVAELQGLTVDDRKAVAGALFEAEASAGFGSLLLYAKAPGGEITLVTLSPNGSEQPPTLHEAQRERPFFGAALRCVPPPAATARAERAAAPPLPHARECIKALRQSQASLKLTPKTPPLAELQKLKAWVESAQRAPAVAQSEASLRELAQLLATPALERLSRDAREERELTEHYAELAEGLDDPNVSAAERERRHAEFASLRRRLGGQIVQGGVGSGSERTQLAALLEHLVKLFEAPPAPAAKPGKHPKSKPPDYKPLLVRLRELRGEKAPGP